MDRPDKVLILDMGSQYTQLIARKIRQLNVYTEIHPHNMPLSEVIKFNPKAIILSGGPCSVYDKDAPSCESQILKMNIPVLGICYGLQLMIQRAGGKIKASKQREYGRTVVQFQTPNPQRANYFFPCLEKKEPLEVWMSHGDRIESLPSEYLSLAYSSSTPYAIVGHQRLPLMGLQFHPEVHHTPEGITLLKNFLFDVAGINANWNISYFLEQQTNLIKNLVQSQEKIICAVSGGVDSTVMAALLARCVPDNLFCVFVDNGLLRKGEVERVQKLFREIVDVPLQIIDASHRFLDALAGVQDPEQKRKIIGHTFISEFKNATQNLKHVKYLAQGTLYPDVIESVQSRGPSATIKSHHNVGGLPEDLGLELIEPFRELFKDEVRVLGRELNLPAEVCGRHPFPGPGMAVRIAGAVDESRLRLVQAADVIVEEEIRQADLYDTCWQCFAVLLPVYSVGVMGDKRTYEQTIVVRCVDSIDGMTADWSPIPHSTLARISNRIVNEVNGVNRVLYDISSKPPATIEWE